MQNGKALLGMGALIAIGIVLGGLLFAQGIAQFRATDRYVTVKGLSERKVISDLATMEIAFVTSGDDLMETQEQFSGHQKTVISFLREQGFNDDEIITGSVRVTNKRAQEWGSAQPGGDQYIIRSSVRILTANIGLVEAIKRKSTDLLAKGVILDSLWQPDYVFSRINDIKLDMLTEATRNAMDAAELFAHNSGSKVAGIRRANQGIFQIFSGEVVGEMGTGYNTDSPYKTVRVVTTVEYLLGRQISLKL